MKLSDIQSGIFKYQNKYYYYNKPLYGDHPDICNVEEIPTTLPNYIDPSTDVEIISNTTPDSLLELSNLVIKIAKERSVDEEKFWLVKNDFHGCYENRSLIYKGNFYKVIIDYIGHLRNIKVNEDTIVTLLTRQIFHNNILYISGISIEMKAEFLLNKLKQFVFETEMYQSN